MTDAPKRIQVRWGKAENTRVSYMEERFFPPSGDAEYHRADLIDMDVLRRVEAALESRCETYIAAGGVPLDDDVIHQLETDALTDLRAMMEQINE